ncbi:MAG: virulence factor [Acidimicrobiaceae bacterium]|nr:virulence factor [Acidimicrobiaceae bacterium]
MSASARRGGRRRRGDDGSLVLISWRDIPAQVNGGSGENRVQRILPRRFQRAIDRAAMVAGKTQASQYVGEWRRSVIPGDAADPEGAAMAAAAELEEAFPRQRLDEFVKTGGWDPDGNGPEAERIGGDS